MGVLLLESSNHPASIGVGELGELRERAPHRFFVLFVEIRPPFPVEQELVAGATPREQLGYSRKSVRGFGEAGPGISPAARSLTESGSGRHIRLGLGIELEDSLALGTEGVPTTVPHPGSRAVGVGHPAEDVAHEVHAGQLVEVGRVQAAAPQLLNRSQGHLVERPEQRGDGRMAGCDIEARPCGGAEKRRHGPIAAFRVVPEGAAVHQLDERLEFVGAVFAGSQLAAFHAGEVDDGGGFGGDDVRCRARRSTTQRSQIAGPVRCSGWYSPRASSSGMWVRAAGRRARHSALGSVHRMAAGVAWPLGVEARARRLRARWSRGVVGADDADSRSVIRATVGAHIARKSAGDSTGYDVSP